MDTILRIVAVDLIQKLTCQMAGEYRLESQARLKYWLSRGRKMINEANISASELRAASIGVRRLDIKLSRQLAKRARALAVKFNQKYK